MCSNAKFVRLDVCYLRRGGASDVVWTVEIPEDSIDFDLHEEEASLYVKNVLVFDAFTVSNSLDLRRPKVHAMINSLRAEWRGTTNRRSHRDCVGAFRGNFFENSATLEVIAPPPRTPATICPARPARSSFKSVSDPAGVCPHIPALFVLPEGQFLREGYVG